MKRFSEQLHKKSLSVKLQAAERRELRERVVSYMEYHPISSSVKPVAKATPSPYFTDSFKVLPFSYLLRTGVAVAVFVLILIPALAENTVPGDGLYAIKVRFNEEVRSSLAMTSYQKIEWETERLNRRIAEARLLASEGRLTEDVENEVAAAVKTHTENAKRQIEVLRGEDAEEATLATIELNTTLEVQAASLLEDQNNPGNDNHQQTNILASAVGAFSAQESATNPGLPGYDKLMARVEMNTTRVQELLTTLQLDENSAEYKDVNRRISDIDKTVEEVIVQRGMNEEAARIMLVDALQRTQKLIVFITELQDGQEFEVEDFVPVVLTEEEQKEKIEQYQKDTRVKISVIETQVASSTDANNNEKANDALAKIQGIQSSIASSTDYAQKKSLYGEANALADDTIKFLENNLIKDIPVETERGTSSEDSVQN